MSEKSDCDSAAIVRADRPDFVNSYAGAAQGKLWGVEPVASVI